MDKKTILKVVVGSQAHGLATPKSDFDFRGVFVVPTSNILSLDGTIKHTQWNEGKDDDTSWELGHFLNLARHCNPTILETFLAPMQEEWVKVSEGLDYDGLAYGKELRSLFPYIWNAKDVMNAFLGYGINQRKKFLENKDNRRAKYATAYLRTLYQGWELLKTGTFTVRIADTPIGEKLKKFKAGEFTVGEVMQECFEWQDKLVEAYDKMRGKKQADLRPVNAFLLKVRKEYWGE